jgi:uncharacterized membrane protein
MKRDTGCTLWRSRTASRGAQSRSSTVPAWSRAFIDTYAPGGNISELSATPRFTVAITSDLIEAKLYNLSMYNAVGYLPAASGVWIAERMHLSPLAIFVAGRIATTTICGLLIALALRFANGSRALLVLIALTPMAVALRASYSGDALVLALSILLAAILLSSRPRVAIAVIAALLIVILKPPYLPVALLACFAIASKRARIAIAVSITIVAIATTILARGASEQTLVRFDATVDASAQMQHVLQHPIDVAGVIVRDLTTKSWQYTREAIGVLGWLDVPLPRIVYWLFALALLMAILVRRYELSRPFSPVAIALFITPFVIALSIYVSWTPPRSDYVDGLQGRYVLPVLPFLALLPPLRKREREARDVALAITFASAVLIVALRAVMQHYATTTSP